MIKWEELSPRQRRRRKRAIIRQGLLVGCAVLTLAGVGLAAWLFLGKEETPELPAASQIQQPITEPPTAQPVTEPEEAPVAGLAQVTEDTLHLTNQVGSEYAIIIDADTNTVLAEKGGDVAVYPASMTKVLTLLVAAEHIADPDGSFTMTQEIIDPHYRKGATITGYRSGDVCTLRDLFYGAGLRSAADATTALAITAAGSEDAFVERMNEKCRELGLSDSARFTNASGMFDSGHTCTLQDMAAIMRAAMNNELCRQVLSTEIYRTAPTEKEPEGLLFQNKYLGWFLERQPEKAEVLACKSGYVAQALNCLVSHGTTAQGQDLICVIARATDAETMMGDHRTLYDMFGK